MEKENNSNIKLRIAITFLVLFILPLGSIYFMTKGRTFNREVFQELTEKGKLGTLKVDNQNNLPIDNELLYGRVTVANFLNENIEMAKAQSAQIAKVHESFDDTEDVYFLSFIPKDTSQNLIDRSMVLGIKDVKQWSLVELDENKWVHMATDIFNKENGNEGIVLVDTSLTVRHHYPNYSDSLIGRLVLHISKVIPKQKRRGL